MKITGTPVYDRIHRAITQINRPVTEITHEAVSRQIIAADQWVTYTINYNTGGILFIFNSLDMDKEQIDAVLGELPYNIQLWHVTVEAYPSDFNQFEPDDPQAEYYLNSVAVSLQNQLENNVRAFITRVIRHIDLDNNMKSLCNPGPTLRVDRKGNIRIRPHKK